MVWMELTQVPRTRRHNGTTPEARRILALMEIYKMPTPTLFGKAVGASQSRISNVTGGAPIGKELAFAIMERFPAVGLEWLWFGTPDAIRSIELAEKLRDYEQRRGVQLFSRRRI